MTESGYMDTSNILYVVCELLHTKFATSKASVLFYLLTVMICILILSYSTELAEKNGIYLYSLIYICILLQNVTHLVQPADVGLFAPLKTSWYKEVQLFAQRNPNKKNVCSVFKATWEEVMSQFYSAPYVNWVFTLWTGSRFQMNHCFALSNLLSKQVLPN